MRNRYVLLLDLPLIALAALGAFLLRFDWFFADRPEFLPFLLIAVLVKPLVFIALGLYGRYWKYATVADLLAVTVGVTTASLVVGLLVVTAVISGSIHEFSRSVLLIDWLLTVVAVGGLRFAFRLWNDRYVARVAGTPGPRRDVLIAGAGAAGAAVLREIGRNPRLGLNVIGLLDDDVVKRGKRIHGVRVLGGLDELADLISARPLHEVIIAMPTAPGATIRRLAETCAAAGVASRTLPGIFELLDGRVSVSRLREVEIADLLRRPEIVGAADAAGYVKGRTVLVTGGGGSIGLELCRQLAHARPRLLVLLGHGENSLFKAEEELREAFPDVPVATVVADIRDSERVRRTLQRFRPLIVFHAAAHKHVPLMEDNPEEAITNNVLGTRNIVDACIAASVERLVMISTDKAVSPTSMMGASKRLAEMIVREGARRSGRAFVVVRFGNVLGSRGSVVPVFKRQIESGGPITITHPDVKRYFMTIPEAVHLVLQAGGLSSGGELFVLNMGEAVAIVQLAEDLIRLSGLSAGDIPIRFTGLRPGEKLEEALWEHDALVEPTPHPDVFRVREHDSIDGGDLGRSLESLVSAASSGDRLRLEAALAQWIPTYVPSSVQKHLSL